jgi:DNA-binding transcriptional LysR family regulator
MSLPRLDLRHLRYFIAVVEQRTFRAAAVRLHVSQPPLTRQIRQLEEVLKVQLLNRSAHGAQPTPAGLVFYEEARNLLTQVEQAAERTRRAAEGRLRRLDVAVYGSAVLGAIPQILHRFRETHPQVEVVLHSLDRAGQVEALRERRIVVGFNRFFSSEPDLSWEVIQTERMYVVVPEHHVLASREMLSLADIGRHPLILYPRAPRPGFIDQMMRMFQLRHITPNISQEVDDIVTAIGLVASGAGLCLVTDSGRTLRVDGTVQIPLRKADQATVELCIIHRTDDDSPLLADFLAVARSMRESLSGPADAKPEAPRRTGRKSAPRRRASK